MMPCPIIAALLLRDSTDAPFVTPDPHFVTFQWGLSTNTSLRRSELLLVAPQVSHFSPVPMQTIARSEHLVNRVIR